MMEDEIGPTSSLSEIVPDTQSVSPSTLDNESPQLEPMMADVKILPERYEQCEFSDLADLIGNILVLSPIEDFSIELYLHERY